MDIDIPLLLSIASSIIIVIISLTFFLKSKAPQAEERPRPVPLPNRPRDGAPRRAQLARNRGARLRAIVPNEDENDSEAEDEQAKPEIELPDGKVGAKKRAKLEAKAEKKAARESEEKLRAEKKKMAELEEAERKKQKDEEEAKEKEKEEEERRIKEEKERKDHEEYMKMKEAFSVEEEGYEEGEQDDSQNLLQDFVNYIKQNKAVIIEDLAARFKLKTQACIDRIKDLQKDDILTGVIDDRGKFIFVSRSEMEAVAKFIKQRGRVSIAELAESSNQLFNLVPVASPAQ